MSDLRARFSARPGRRPWMAVLVCLTLAAGAAACGARGFRPPEGPTEPAPEAAAWLAEATARCATVSTFQGEIGLSGRVGNETVPPATLRAGLTRDEGVYIDARQMGVNGLWLSGRADRATLWLRDGNLFLTAPAPDIVEALIGIRIEPSRLLAALVGCVSRDVTAGDAVQYDSGRRARVATPDATLYLRREAGGWRVEAGAFDGLIAEIVPGLVFPAQVRLRSEAAASPQIALRLEVSTSRVNEPIGDAAFTQTPPADASPMTLDELRAAGPLKRRDGGG